MVKVRVWNATSMVKVRVYVGGRVVVEVEVPGPLSTKGAQSGGKKGGRKS